MQLSTHAVSNYCDITTYSDSKDGQSQKACPRINYARRGFLRLATGQGMRDHLGTSNSIYLYERAFRLLIFTAVGPMR